MFQPNDLPILNDLQFVSGQDFSFPFFIGQPTSGYGFNAYMNIPASGFGIVPFQVFNDDLINGGVSLFMPNATTSGMPGGSYPYQFSFTNLQGLKTVWFQGTIAVLPPA